MKRKKWTLKWVRVPRRQWKGDRRSLPCQAIPAGYFKSRTFYKVLKADGTTPVAHVAWSLPKADWTPMWHTVTGRLVPCKNGLHIIDNEPAAVRRWIAGPRTANRRLFVVEVYGSGLRHGKRSDRKYVVRTARLVREIVRGTKEWKAFFVRAGLPELAEEQPS